MDDNKFLASVWALVAAVVISLITAFTVSQYITVSAVKHAVSAGYDPILARCGYANLSYSGGCGHLRHRRQPARCASASAKIEPKRPYQTSPNAIEQGG